MAPLIHHTIKKTVTLCINCRYCCICYFPFWFCAGGIPLIQRPPPVALGPAVAVPVGLSLSDFPVLGSKPPKTQGAPKKADSTVVFRDAFHSRLREEHSAHVRAVEEVEELCKERKRGRLPSVEEVNSRAEELIRAIAAEGELVTVDKVCLSCKSCYSDPSSLDGCTLDRYASRMQRHKAIN